MSQSLTQFHKFGEGKAKKVSLEDSPSFWVSRLWPIESRESPMMGKIRARKESWHGRCPGHRRLHWTDYERVEWAWKDFLVLLDADQLKIMWLVLIWLGLKCEFMVQKAYFKSLSCHLEIPSSWKSGSELLFSIYKSFELMQTEDVRFINKWCVL